MFLPFDRGWRTRIVLLCQRYMKILNIDICICKMLTWFGISPIFPDEVEVLSTWFGKSGKIPDQGLAPGLPEFLLADGGDEFLEVEWFEVGDVLEIAGAVGGEGGGEHSGGLRVALEEAGVRVLQEIGTFAGTVTDKEAWALLQIFCEAVLIDDHRGCFGDLPYVIARTSRGRGNLKDSSIDFHATCVDHRDDESGADRAVGDVLPVTSCRT